MIEMLEEEPKYHQLDREISTQLEHDELNPCNEK